MIESDGSRFPVLGLLFLMFLTLSSFFAVVHMLARLPKFQDTYSSQVNYASDMPLSIFSINASTSNINAGKNHEGVEATYVGDIGSLRIPKYDYKRHRMAVFHVFTGKRADLLSGMALDTYYFNRNLLDLYIFVDKNREYDQMEEYCAEHNIENIFIYQLDNLSELIIKQLISIFPELGHNTTFTGSAQTHTFGWNLCDVRPFFYEVFLPYLNRDRTYTHWAWTDKHTILGDLDHFLPESDLDQFDVITFLENGIRTIITSGTFSIFRISQGADGNMPIWKYMHHEDIITTLLDPRNNQNDEIRFPLSLIRQPNIAFLALITNLRDWREARIYREPFMIFNRGVTTHGMETDFGSNLDAVLPAKIVGKREDVPPRPQLFPDPLRAGYRLEKRRQETWNVSVRNRQVNETSVCHCKKPSHVQILDHL